GSPGSRAVAEQRTARRSGHQTVVRTHHRRSAAPGADCRRSTIERSEKGRYLAMVVVMRERATDEQVQNVIAKLMEIGVDVHRSTGALRTVLGAVGGSRQFDTALLEVLDGVQEVHRITEPYKLASRTFRPDNTVVSIGDVRVGGDEVVVMAGPCSAETEE